MQRVQIEGYGIVPLVDPSTTTVGALEDLQDETDWDDAELQKRMRRQTSATIIGLYLSLRAAGHEVTYEQVRGLRQTDLKVLPTPKDRKPKAAPAEQAEQAQDPTSAPTGSVRGDGTGEE